MRPQFMEGDRVLLGDTLFDVVEVDTEWMRYFLDTGDPEEPDEIDFEELHQGKRVWPLTRRRLEL